MQIITDQEFTQQSDRFLRRQTDEPIVVEKANGPVAVILSPRHFERFQDLEELYDLVQDEMRN